MRVGHICAGIGGGILADLILGHEVVFAVEIDEYCQAILKEKLPKVRIHRDVREFSGDEYIGKVDCISAGFPCQDISSLGSRDGLEGRKSKLFWEIIRVANRIRPRWIFLENVSSIVSNGLSSVCGALATSGYDAEWLCLGAGDLDAPHERDRWWCLARLSNAYSVRESQSNWTDEEVWRRAKHIRQETADAMCIGLQSELQSGPAQGSAGRGHPWGAEPDVVRVVHGVPYRLERIKALGNAQVPICAALAFTLLIRRYT